MKRLKVQGLFGSVVEPDLKETGKVVFDLSVGSLELDTVADLVDPAMLSSKLSGRMEVAGAKVGVGRYDEARLMYLDDAFKAEKICRVVRERDQREI